MSLFSGSFYQNIPRPPAKMPPPLHVPSPALTETICNDSETEIDLPKEGRESLSGERRPHRSSNEALTQALIDRLDETCVTGAAGVIFGRVELDTDDIFATFFAPQSWRTTYQS